MGQGLIVPSPHVMPVVHRAYPWQVAPQQSLLPFRPDAQF